MDGERVVKEAKKICGVCGDKALGYNFNAVSCESCKAFFRRNALKEKDFLCPFSANCTITPITRRFCQKCRLKKCFSIGMRKEHIMTDDDKVLKRKKIEQNRAKKKPYSSKNDGFPSAEEKHIEKSNCDSASTLLKQSFTIPSVTHGTYQKRFDGNWGDVNPCKHSVAKNMSPTIAASVPSPSSPLENCHIFSSKTLDMLEYLHNDHSPNPTKIDHLKHQNLDDFSSEKISSQMYHNAESHNNYVSQKILPNSSRTTDITMMCKSNEYEQLKIDQNICRNTWNHPKCQDRSSDATVSKMANDLIGDTFHTGSLVNRNKETIVPNYLTTSTESAIDESSVMQESNGTLEKNVVISMLMHNPAWVVEILNNPEIIAKFIKDQDFIEKLISDPLTLKVVQKNIASKNESTTLTNLNLVRDSIRIESSDNDEDSILKCLIYGQSCGTEQLGKNVIVEDPEWIRTSVGAEDFDHDSQRNVAEGNSVESVLYKAIKLEYSPSNLIHDNMDLNDTERAKLNELIIAHRALSAPLNEDVGYTGDLEKSDSTLLGVINLTAVAVRRFIKMSKKISAFKNMCQEDQLALLKGGCTEMMLLRSAIHYDPDKEIWKILETKHKMTSIKVDILKEAKGNLFTEHSKFVSTFDSRWRDENIILILCAIALFSPERSKVIHRDVIKLEQNSYYYLLRRYLESVYPKCEAKSTFLKLIQKMSELHKLNKEVVEVYLNVDPSSIEPLLIEIFDLKR
ncbi:hypothetical protein QAD02_023609 [Eretmocerus hayati]|uniref:Uncharacterized protein n=1 Tax=Eretmocerus hayati TaxID=131215 RepID=A0ACC2PWM2_9HYME|nr:hypothetical protein QAD02_023609 [Eretmocerus hayati]